MKYAIASEQRKFFEVNRHLEIESFFQLQQIERLKTLESQILASRLGFSVRDLERTSAQQLFMAGHDFFREDNELKRIIAAPWIGELFFDLMNVKPLRIAFDQYLPSERLAHTRFGLGDRQYAEFLQKIAPLEENVSIQGLVGCLLVCIEGSEAPVEGLPTVGGNALICAPDYALNLSALEQPIGSSYMLVGYCKDKSVYKFQPNDPHTHSLKKLGCVFGDRLTEKLHPTFFR